MKKFISVLSFILFISQTTTATSWHKNLYLDGGSMHTKRVEIKIQNPTEANVEKGTIKIPAKSLGIVNCSSRELRLVSESNNELNFSITPESETITSDTYISVPTVCKAGETARMWLYYNNPDAIELPSNLPNSDINLNIDFNNAITCTPQGWNNSSREGYFNSLEKSSGRNSTQCVSTTAAPNSKPQWVSIAKSWNVSEGDKYNITAYVRGDKVEGAAGFFMHIGKRKILNNKNRGTFDWQKIEFKGEVKKGENHITFGTLLYAKSGKAYFDDFKIEITRADSKCTYIIGKEETFLLNCPKEESWHLNKETFPTRAIVSIRNITSEVIQSPLCTIPINRITNANLTPESFSVIVDGKEMPFILASGNMVFIVNEVPAKSEKLVYVYLNKNRKNLNSIAEARQASGILSDYATKIKSSPSTEAFRAIMLSPVNLLKNPDFEDDTIWKTHKSKDIEFGIEEGGIFGKRKGFLRIKNNAKKGWHGLRQKVDTDADTDYILLGWARADSGKPAVHAHYNAPQPKTHTTFSAPVSAEWEMFSIFISSFYKGNISVELTSTRGNYDYDGIVLAKCVRGNYKTTQSATDFSDEIHIWQSDNIVKVFPTTCPETTSIASIDMAKNEVEAILLGIRSNNDFGKVELTATAPVYSDKLSLSEKLKTFIGNFKIPQLPLPEISVIGNVIIDSKSRYTHFNNIEPHERVVPAGSFAVQYPDPLFPTNTFELKGKFTSSVNLAFKTPKDARSGIYKGEIFLKKDGKILKSLPYQIYVANITLPDERNLIAIFDVRCRKHGMTPKKTAEFLRTKSLLADKPKAYISFTLKDGKPVADFSKFDIEADYYINKLKSKRLYLPINCAYFGWGRPLNSFLGEQSYLGKYPYDDADRSKLNPKYRKYVVEAMRQVEKHLDEKGWTDKFIYYVSDEPFAKRPHILKQMSAICDALHEGAPKIKIYASTWYYVPEWIGKIDIWGIGAQGQISEEDIKKIKDAGHEILTTTDGQFVLDNPYNALERILPLYCYKYGFIGYEFWGADWYTLNPLKWGIHRDIAQSDTPGKHYRVRYPNGDGYICYPGSFIGQENPFSSLRLESHRDGVEDYELLVMLDTLVKSRPDTLATKTLENIKKLAYIPNAGRDAVLLLPNPTRYTALRSEIIRHIERLSK